MTGSAQTTANTYSVSGWWGAGSPPFSPVVTEKGDVLFRIRAPKASKVELLFGEWNVQPKLMSRDTAGTWSIELNSVASGIYSYLFNVDDTRTPDFSNPLVKTGTELYGSVVEVNAPGRPRFDQVQEVAHGTIEIKRYISSAKRSRQLYIYLPPGYYTRPQAKFPVLYLRHGGGDNESSWTQESGRAHIILENLLAGGQAVPMIIVMPNGLTDGSWSGGSSKEGMTELEDELLQDIIPLVEKGYRVRANAAGRAIAGLSMGGGQAYIMGLRHPDVFAWISEFSSGLLSDIKFDLNERAPGVFDHPEQLNKKLRLLFIGCGSDDPRYPGHLALDNQLTRSGIRHRTYNVTGGHEWKVWREELRVFMTALFRR